MTNQRDTNSATGKSIGNEISYRLNEVYEQGRKDAIAEQPKPSPPILDVFIDRQGTTTLRPRVEHKWPSFKEPVVPHYTVSSADIANIKILTRLWDIHMTSPHGPRVYIES